jgi:hypothetical protein
MLWVMLGSDLAKRLILVMLGSDLAKRLILNGNTSKLAHDNSLESPF